MAILSKQPMIIREVTKPKHIFKIIQDITGCTFSSTSRGERHSKTRYTSTCSALRQKAIGRS